MICFSNSRSPSPHLHDYFQNCVKYIFLISMRWHQLVILLLLLLVVVEAAKKKPSKGELGMMIRMSRRILDD